MKTAQREFPTSKALQVQSRFESWRSTRNRKDPIPDELWKAAVELTKRHSVYKVARLLRLDYANLKKRGMNNPVATTAPEKTELTSFIELPLIPQHHCESCLIELKRPDGTEMQIRLSNSPDADLPSLIKAFAG